MTYWKRPWCWEGLGAGGEGDDRGWDGWMASPTQRTWVWVNSRSWRWTGRPGVLWFTGSQSRTWLSDWTELKMSWVRRGRTRDMTGDVSRVHIMREPKSFLQDLTLSLLAHHQRFLNSGEAQLDPFLATAPWLSCGRLIKLGQVWGKLQQSGQNYELKSGRQKWGCEEEWFYLRKKIQNLQPRILWGSPGELPSPNPSSLFYTYIHLSITDWIMGKTCVIQPVM